ncbi:MAG: type IV toxin-antitoxin system AbiEi family antitoxin domain-containing protein [Chlamydiae bacterium]|nr:type IV toxin-antitoxin system AbiEi family antitoxin domain-containing protein [Chlamydiota bacterium]
MGRKKNQKIEQTAIEIFKSQGGILRYKDALKLGIHPRTLYALKNAGTIEQLQRGLFCLQGLPGHTQPDFVTVAKKIPDGVICLISALFFHKLTTQIPHFIYLAVKKGYKPPKVNYLPIRFFWFSNINFPLGIESHRLHGVTIHCYSREKTIVDCFRYRDKIGIDVAIEALKKYWQQGNPRLDLIMKFAKAGRVEKIIKPYIEAVINESS